ncbi:MAG: transglutaminase domain-containing protein, partial [Cyanobacteria bacterium P01_F01_bin.153]
PNLIPAMAAPGEVYFPTGEIGLDSEGGLRSPRVLDEGLTFSIISRVPYRDRKGLQQASQSYPKRIRETYLEVPDGVKDRLRKEGERLLAKADPPRESVYEQTLFLAQALKQTYRIQTELEPLKEGEDLVEAFLFEREGGQPDQFPTALAMMLRSLGIPARIAVGFSPGRFNLFTGLYEVYNTDAHAVTEVYFPEYGWFAFDPIPGHPLVPPSVEESQTFSALEQLWAWIAGWLPTPLRNGLEGLVAAIAAFISGIIGTLLGWFSQGWLGAIAGSISLVVLGAIIWFLVKFWRQWSQQRALKKLPPMESLYRQIVISLARDYPKQPWQTPMEYAQAYETWAANEPHGAPGRSRRVDLLRQISHAYVNWRYGEKTPDVEQLQRRWKETRKLPLKRPSKRG